MIQTKHLSRLISTIILLNFSNAYGQFSPKAIRFSFANEGIVLPSGRLYQSPIHPAFFIGIDTKVKNKNNWQTTRGLELGFYHHRLSENALMLDLRYSKGYKVGKFLPTFLAMLGIKQSMPVSEVYKLKDGQYEKVRAIGKTQFAPKLGIGLEYAANDRISFMTDYKIMLSLPYSNDLPFSPHTFLGVGIKLNLQNN
jgi:hypothetical protein